MISRAGLNLHSAGTVSKQKLGFGSDEDDSKKPVTAEKIADAANKIEDEFLKPTVEVGIVGTAATASYNTAGAKLAKIVDKPTSNLSSSIGEFLVKHNNDSKGFIGKALRKIEPLKRMIAEKGPDAATHITQVVKKSSNKAIKLFAGLVGAVFVGKEMPKFEKTAGEVIKDLGTVAVVTDIAA